MIFGSEMTLPPPLEFFRKFIRFGRATRPLVSLYMYVAFTLFCHQIHHSARVGEGGGEPILAMSAF